MMVTMLVGPVGCGKTTLAQAMHGQRPEDAKTQTIELLDDLLDTPGEYLEHGRFNHALLLASHEADAVLLLESACDDEARVPPSFATMFTCPVLGVVTKIDAATAEGIAAARDRLAETGAHDVVEICALDGRGLDDLRHALARLDTTGLDTTGLDTTGEVA